MNQRDASLNLICATGEEVSEVAEVWIFAAIQLFYVYNWNSKYNCWTLSSVTSPFDRAHMTSYSALIETMHLYR